MADHVSTGAAAAHPGREHYQPAMGRRWLLPLYDPFTRLLGAGRVHGDLLDRADIRPGHRVLEIGCGTGNLLLLAKKRCPDVEAAGLDPDPAALRRAGRKAARTRLPVRLDRGFAADLPYPDASVDRVLSSFMLHHLEPADLPAVLREVARVLRPGGSFHVVDVVGGHRRHGPAGLLARRARHLAQHLADNSPGPLPDVMAAAGLREAAQTGRGSTRIGDYAFYRAVR